MNISSSQAQLSSVENVNVGKQPSGKQRKSLIFILTGLSLLITLGVVAIMLFLPLQTRQIKERGLLSGNTPQRITYQLSFEHSSPQRLTLKLAASQKVKISLLSKTNQVLFTTTQVASKNEPLPLTVDLPSDLLAPLLTSSQLASPTVLQQIPCQLLLEFGGGSWAVAYSDKDVYQNGLLQVGDTAPTSADLYFVITYNSGPGAIIASFFAQQQVFGGLPWLAVSLVVVAILLWISGLVLLLCKPALLTIILTTKSGYFKFSGGLLGLTFCWTMAYVLINPPLQGPDEVGHIGRSIAAARHVPIASLKPEVLTLMQQTHFVDNFYWETYNDHPIDEYPVASEVGQTPLFYVVAAKVVGLFEAFQPSLAVEIYLVRLVSVLFLLGTVGAGLAAGWLLRHESRWLALGLPLTLALLPAALFTGSVANNDNAAICFGAWAAFAMLWLYRAVLNRQRWIEALALLVVALVLGYLGKRTMLTVVPAYLVGLWLLIVLRVQSNARRIILAATAALLLIGVVGLFLITDTHKAVKGWFVDSNVYAGRASGTGATGLDVDTLAIEQRAYVFYRPPVNKVYFQATLRPEKIGAAKIQIDLIALDVPFASRQIDLDASNPTTVTFDATVPSRINTGLVKPFILLRFTKISGEAVQVSGLQLNADTPDGQNLLINTSGVESVPSLVWDWRGNMPNPSCKNSICVFLRSMYVIAGNGRGIDQTGLFIQNIVSTVLSSWEVFGWGQHFVDSFWYLLWALITFAALLGLFFRTNPSPKWQSAYYLFCAIGLPLTFVYQYISRVENLTIGGTPDTILARFYFVMLFPLAFVLLNGLYKFSLGGLSFRKSRRKQLEVNSSAETGLPVRAWFSLGVWTVWLAGFNLVVLLLYILPFYYS